jgi:hypothetical protein
MGLKVRRSLMLACVGALLVPAAVSAATGASKVDPTAAASACAHGRALNARLGAGDVAYITRFVPCVLRAERGQLKLTYTQSAPVSRLVMTALTAFVKLPYVTQHKPKAAVKAGLLAGGAIAVKTCQRLHGIKRGLFQASWGDTSPPPVLTPLVVSTDLGKLFANPRAIVRKPNAVFGTAARRGLLFEKGNLNGAAVGVVAVTCP